MNNKPLILADAHVHFYDCFNLEQLLNYAWENFNQVAHTQFNQSTFQGILCLTETEHQNYFEKLSHQVQTEENVNLGQWIVSSTQEDASLLVHHHAGRELIIIAGSQIISLENLEVLALITKQQIPSGLSLGKTIEMIITQGGIPVLPWAFGKWMGARGKTIQDLLNLTTIPKLFLGDNGGRPEFWKRPPYFTQAEEKGLRILPGTDPLPLDSELSRPGSFGFALDAKLSAETPGQDIQDILFNSDYSIHTYGSLERTFRFIKNQFSLRLKK